MSLSSLSAGADTSERRIPGLQRAHCVELEGIRYVYWIPLHLQARTLAFRKAHANIDATIRSVEVILDRFDIAGQVEQRIKDGPRRDLDAYLAAVDKLKGAIDFFDLHPQYKAAQGAALQARSLMKDAMQMLEADFQQLLANNRWGVGTGQQAWC